MPDHDHDDVRPPDHDDVRPDDDDDDRRTATAAAIDDDDDLADVDPVDRPVLVAVGKLIQYVHGRQLDVDDLVDLAFDLVHASHERSVTYAEARARRAAAAATGHPLT